MTKPATPCFLLWSPASAYQQEYGLRSQWVVDCSRYDVSTRIDAAKCPERGPDACPRCGYLLDDEECNVETRKKGRE